MNESDKKEFLLKFYNSRPILLLKECLLGTIGRPMRFLFLDDTCGLVIKEKRKYYKCIQGFLKKLRSNPLKKIKSFECSCGEDCLLIPVTQGDKIYGYIILAHLKQELDVKYHHFVVSFVDTALKEFQKEQELAKLYDTIRPRAIALSTIHTIHRLLTSTLDMSELIERIARLTLQVMRAKSCSIMLLDESRGHLVPKAVIDLKNNNKGGIRRKHKKIKIGAGIEGKVAKTGKTSLSHNSICVPLIEEDIMGIIIAKNKANNVPFNKFDLEILLTLAEQAVIAIRNARLYEEQDKMAYGSIKSLAALLDAKSPNTYTHSENFVKVVLAIAEEMRLPREEVRNLRYAALLPDTGRFSIPDEILKKRGGLSDQEYKIIKQQHLESLKILEPLEFLKPAIPTIMYHHERYDGSGYPKGLKGAQIPIGARIMAVADAFEAMMSSRPYKDAKVSLLQALKEIQNNKGMQFDPDVVDAFIAVSKKPEFKKIYS